MRRPFALVRQVGTPASCWRSRYGQGTPAPTPPTIYRCSGEAFAQVPAAHRKHLLVRGDSAAATHKVIDWLTDRNRARRMVEYSIGWAIGEPDRTAIAALPARDWQPTLADGDLREGAQVAELTGLLQLSSWPAGMRVIVRRERPHPAPS